jgi:5-methylcytosine-specific restriction endonuclease McrA
MARAPKICSTPRCGNMQPCPDHVRVAWADSRRSERSALSGWAQQRRAQRILETDDTCHVCQRQGSDQVDHVIPLAEGGADDATNLAPIHRIPCHRDKTAAEATRGRGSRTPWGGPP